jgi:hypothetical protein
MKFKRSAWKGTSVFVAPIGFLAFLPVKIGDGHLQKGNHLFSKIKLASVEEEFTMSTLTLVVSTLALLNTSSSWQH